MKPPDPAGDLQPGPAEDWRPGQDHLKRIHDWTVFFLEKGLPTEHAKAWAFEIWKRGQKATYR